MGADTDIASLDDEARELLPAAIELRRTLHEWPEIGNELPVAREKVLEAIDGLPLDVTLHETTSGIAAVLNGAQPGPTMLLRSDMDALPMPEDTGLDFSSRVDGAMHACGHDLHTAILAGAARLLTRHRDRIAGRILFMFQPGEEGYAGAKFMLEEGLLDLPPLPDGSDSPVQHAFAMHVTSILPTGAVATRGGPLMASSDSMTITVRGRGGHASQPHLTLDPIPVACEIVQALQTMVTRRVDAFDPAVVTVGRIRAGTAFNVIPETAVINGTIRAVSERTRSLVSDGIRRVAEGIAAAHEMEAEVILDDGYPVTVNDHDDAGHASTVAARLLGESSVIQLPNPVMGAEDFSYVLDRIPGTMMFLGGKPDNVSNPAPNHSNRVMFDEAAMSTGIAMYAAMALSRLGV
jgi:amidohydrolase